MILRPPATSWLIPMWAIGFGKQQDEPPLTRTRVGQGANRAMSTNGLGLPRA